MSFQRLWKIASDLKLREKEIANYGPSTITRAMLERGSGERERQREAHTHKTSSHPSESQCKRQRMKENYQDISKSIHDLFLFF